VALAPGTDSLPAGSLGLPFQPLLILIRRTAFFTGSRSSIHLANEFFRLSQHRVMAGTRALFTLSADVQ
jgi:hypothetical protein